MTRSEIMRTTLATLVAAVAVAPIGLAGGEPKNELPFTRSVTATAIAPQASAPTSGESKNETPFTRPISTPPTIVVRGRDSFDWAAAAIGAAAGIGLSLAAAGAVAFTRIPRTPRATATL